MKSSRWSNCLFSAAVCVDICLIWLSWPIFEICGLCVVVTWDWFFPDSIQVVWDLKFTYCRKLWYLWSRKVFVVVGLSLASSCQAPRACFPKWWIKCAIHIYIYIHTSGPWLLRYMAERDLESAEPTGSWAGKWSSFVVGWLSADRPHWNSTVSLHSTPITASSIPMVFLSH